MKILDINPYEYTNIETYELELYQKGIPKNKLTPEEQEIYNNHKNVIRAFMITNMRQLGFKYSELELYFKRHFPNEYESGSQELVYVIERK